MGSSVAWRARFRAALACVIGVTAVGCKRPAPDDARRPPAVRSVAPTPSPVAPGASVPAAPGASVPAAPGDAAVEDATSDVFREGNWVRCYAGFAARDTPALDVMRLGLMCGPSNGMRRVAGARWEARKGDCYRVFAVGGPGVQALRVSVVAGAGRILASTIAARRWAVLEPDGAFCSPQAGAYQASARVVRGQGKTAVEVWRLR